jgi:hypothetical protein
MRHAILLLASLLLFGPPSADQKERCVAGELALPSAPPWAAVALDTVPKGRTACVAMRMVAPEQISGVVVFRATPKGTGAIADAPHPRLLMEAMAQLESMNVKIAEPKWRRQDVPFSGAGMTGFGNGTMFGFDGVAKDDGEKSDVIVFVFDGPAHHYDVSLVGRAESESAEEWRATVAAFRALLSGLNVVKR